VRRLDDAWDYSDPVGSEQRLRDLRNVVAGDPIAGAEATTQIARALGLQGRFAEANALLDDVESDDPVVSARVALERGRVRNSSGDPGAATPYFQAALERTGEAGDQYLQVDALHMLAIVDPEGAEGWTRQGLRVALASGDVRTRRWRGALHNNLGWSLHDAGSYKAALAEFERALGAFEETGTPDQVHIAHWTVARCLRSLGRLDQALAIQERLKADDPADEYVDEEIALLREAIGGAGEPA
jgi:tetratricopeptide (TPR) repeat protein